MDGPAESPAIDWQPSAASAILEFPNILRIICSNLASKDDLLNMALSCKAVGSTALDEIWCSRSSMAQLLAPLYCDGFIELIPSTQNLSLRRTLTDQDSAWARFCEHASRVQVLVANEDFCKHIHHGTMLRLMQLTGGRPIFPNLRRLTVSGNEGGTVVSDLPLFVSATLSHVSIKIDSKAKDASIASHLVDWFLFMMQEQGIPLKNLSLMAKIPVISPLFYTLSRYITLRVLCLEGIRCLDADETSWSTDLGLLQGLEELRLVAEEEESHRTPLQAPRATSAFETTVGKQGLESKTTASSGPGPPEPKVVPKYVSLKRLYLQGPPSVVGAVISCLASQVLDDLTLKPGARRTVQNVPGLYSCLRLLSLQTHLHGSLKRFTFEANLRVNDHQNIPFSASWFEAILRMPRLEYLEVGNQLDSTETFIHSIVAHLPYLVECLISLSSPVTEITILHILATSCPNLTRLQLPIRTSFPPFDSMRFAPRQHCLHHLTVQG
ncbi:hypothetical protein BKA70DRAFT_1307914 [Coprinopsis sp. MPI-PUGE-AT-0042]|nr:hypothetical protein BKA70DRAFT_1307914 [Coprinopsis sp. MPI-PUGE-AT-0042]